MPIVRFSTHLPTKEIVVRINDRGAVANVQEECSSLSLNHTLRDSILMANNDRFSIIMDVPADLNVLANDSLPKSCGAPTVEIETPPLHGVASVGSGNMIRYEPFAGYVGADTVTYRLSCNGNATVAAASISVKNRPGGMGSANCLITAPVGAMGEIGQKAISSHRVHSKAMPFVGDIDRDGLPEVVAPAAETAGGVLSLLVFDYKLQLKTTISSGSNTVSFPEDEAMTFLVANVDDDRYGEIVTCTSNKEVYCYSHDGNIKWKMTSPYSGSAAVNPCPIAADIDGDGKVEILVADVLIAGESGRMLLSLSGVSGLGLLPNVAYMPVFADIDNDGIQELVCGNATYKVNITNRNGTA